MTSTRFQTLLLREWMQHKRGWLVTLLAPPLLFLAMLPFGEVHGMPMDKPLAIGLLGVVMTSVLIFMISMTSATFQLPSLARRDAQDRSIEFWLSLPASHSEAIAATILAHLLLVPLAIGVIAYGIGFIVAAAVAVKAGGIAALGAIPWGSVLGFSAPVLLRLAFGVLLAMLWAAPLVMIVMNASAWLKRWGVPALAATAVVLMGILPKLYGIDLFRDWFHDQMHGMTHAVVYSGHSFEQQAKGLDLGEAGQLSAWAWHDAMQALQALVDPQLLGGLLIAAIGFYGLILRRRRGA
jgi:hypothetical protein